MTRVQAAERFGRLTTLREDGRRFGQCLWLCRCDCGGTITTLASSLRTRHTRSCGCLVREGVVARLSTHGLSRHPIYNVWVGMYRRCYEPSSDNYKHYGGRGITICDRWHSIEKFVADMAPRPDGGELDRRDNDGNYEPSNCRWATRSGQMANTRLTGRYFTLDDEPTSQMEMSRWLAIPQTTLRRYLRRAEGDIR